MKQLKCIIKSFILLSLIVSLSSCDMLSGGKKGNKEKNPKVGDTVQFLKFNPDAASALGVVDKKEGGQNASVRNAKTNELILKILEDGSFESFLSLPEGTQGELADIVMITQSPNPETNCFYIMLDNDSDLTTPKKKTDEDGNEWVENEKLYIGPLLCVFDDGSYTEILPACNSDPDSIKREWPSDNPEKLISFDKQGNMFYVVTERGPSGTGSVTVIYKYDPNTNTSTQLTVKVQEAWFQKIQISSDGKWLFEETLRNGGTTYIRAIPTDNPDNPVDIYYSAAGTGSYLRGWVYDDDTECVYFSADGSLYKSPKKDGTFSSDNNEAIFGMELYTKKWCIDDKDEGFFDADKGTYVWKTAYKDGDSVDAAKVLAKLASVCKQEIDFKLTGFKDLNENACDYSSLYTDKINEEAVQFLDAPEKLQLLYSYIQTCCSDPTNGNIKFLNMTCFIKDTDETAYEVPDPNAERIWWDAITNLTPSYQKSLYETT